MAFFKQNKPRYVRIVVAGPPKSGKTYLVLELSKSELFGPLGHIDIEQGSSFYHDLVADNGSEICVIDDLMEMNNVADKLLNFAHKGKFPFKTIAIDSLTTLWNRHRMVYSEFKSTIKEDGPEEDLFKEKQKMLQDWGKIKEIYHRLLFKFLSMPCHIIFIGWESEIIDIKKMAPTGEMKAKIEKNTDYFVDCTLRIDDVKGNRVFRVDYSRTKAVKDGDPATVETLEKIIKALDSVPKTPKPSPENNVDTNSASMSVKDEETKSSDSQQICAECGTSVNNAIAILSKKQCDGVVKCLKCLKKK